MVKEWSTNYLEAAKEEVSCERVFERVVTERKPGERGYGQKPKKKSSPKPEASESNDKNNKSSRKKKSKDRDGIVAEILILAKLV